MILEIALRIRHSIPKQKSDASSDSFEKWIKFGQYGIISIALVGFAVYVTLYKIGKNSLPFFRDDCGFSDGIAFSFLALFILMGSANILLVF